MMDYFKDVKKLIDEHKAVQAKNLKLAELLSANVLEIQKLRECEQKLKCQIRDVLVHTVNIENISGHYMELKDKYRQLVDEKETAEDLFKRKEDTLVEQHQKQVRLYQDMLAKEQEKFKLKEVEYFNELKKTSTALSEQVQQVELKWKLLLEDANRKLKDSNLSCSTLRAQLVHANQRRANLDFMEKRVRELENKLESKECELDVARQALHAKGNLVSASPPRSLYKRNNSRGPFWLSKKPTSLNVSGDAPPSAASESNFRYNTLKINATDHLPNLSESAPENSLGNNSLNVSIRDKHNSSSSCKSPPVKELLQRQKKRKLYDPLSSQMDYMLHKRPNY